MLLLRKTIDEMELRIETQKQTLTTRDESIKKLLAMLQSKSGGGGGGAASAAAAEVAAAQQYEDDRREIERLTERTMSDGRRIQQLERLLEQRDKEVTFLAEVHVCTCLCMISQGYRL